ncbi:MAG: ACP S-malonyltransferase [Candidatus Omnitrophica bacterium]|nr:ACP S-malonyltransferase [Candidatus Omnitrophota bacterium]MCM8826917.1 ACP S-malonyltransferase [Candidatus Omnitrophota bacterium]
MKAVIFPGQGAQYVGMGKDLNDNFPKAREIFNKIDSILGFKLSQRCFLGPSDVLKDTATQQLAILATSLAVFEIFREKNIEISYFSGLSLGEYTCLYPSGVLSLEELIILVKERASAMQEAALSCPSSMLAVIGLEENVLREENKDSIFYIANINSSRQIVVSVDLKNKDRVKLRLESLKAKIVELDVSGGFHSPFMEKAKERLKKVMENLNFSDAKVPIVSNFTAKSHIKAKEIKENLINQLTHTVLWKECVEFMINKGVRVFFELGPSSVLKGIIKKINPQLEVFSVEKKDDLDNLP